MLFDRLKVMFSNAVTIILLSTNALSFPSAEPPEDQSGRIRYN